jgi:hypothetical protein
LRLRGDDVRAYGTDKEHTLRVPEDPFYKQMAAEFTKNQIAVDIFSFSEKYSDIASLGKNFLLVSGLMCLCNFNHSVPYCAINFL